LTVVAGDLLNGARQRCFIARRRQQVIVILHHRKGMDSQREVDSRVLEQIEEYLAIVVVEKDRFLVVAALHDVDTDAGQIDAWRTRHAAASARIDLARHTGKVAKNGWVGLKSSRLLRTLRCRLLEN